MEGSITIVVDPSKCRTSTRKIKGENPSDPEGTLIYYYRQVRRDERRSYKIPGALPKETQSRL